MFNNIKRVIYFIFILIIILGSSNIYAVVSPTYDFYVNDYAHILSSDTHNYIMEKSKELDNSSGAQIVVVTVNDLNGESIDDYALEVFNNFGIGSIAYNNGLLFLVAVDEREVRVETGTGLESILPENKINSLLDEYVLPYFKDNEWDKGIINGYNAFYQEIVNYNKLNITYDSPVTYSSTNNYNLYILIIFIIISKR